MTKCDSCGETVAWEEVDDTPSGWELVDSNGDPHQCTTPTHTKNDHSYYRTKEWKDLRYQVMFRDKRCYACWATGTLQVHHLIMRTLGKDHGSNLITLCSMCHQHVHKALRMCRTKKPHSISLSGAVEDVAMSVLRFEDVDTTGLYQLACTTLLLVKPQWKGEIELIQHHRRDEAKKQDTHSKQLLTPLQALEWATNEISRSRHVRRK